MERKWEPLTLLYQGISKSSEVVEDGGIICKEVTQACLWARCQILLQSTDLEDRQGEKKKKSTLGEGALAQECAWGNKQLSSKEQFTFNHLILGEQRGNRAHTV